MMRGLIILFVFKALTWVTAEAQQTSEPIRIVPNEVNLMLAGSALLEEDRIILTRARGGETGSCFYVASPVSLTDGFETEFIFRVRDHYPAGNPGNGFAFVISGIHPAGYSPLAQAQGYAQHPNSVIIAFQTSGKGLRHSSNIHLALPESDPFRFRTEATVYAIPEIWDGKPHFARIVYRNKVLAFYMDDYLFPVLQVHTDLTEYIEAGDDQIWIGFTAHAGNSGASVHELLEWIYKEYIPPPEDIVVEDIEVTDVETFIITNPNVTLSIWDHNKIDGDIASIMINDEWVVTHQLLDEHPFEFEYRFSRPLNRVVLYANDEGSIPPCTVTLRIDDGTHRYHIVLNADARRSEAIWIEYRPK